MKKVPHRRRREKKTDYNQRLRLLKSNEYRLVVRKSNNSTIGQIIKYEKNGDKTLVHSSTLELKSLGWENHTGNVPAAYLAGLLLGKRARDKKIKKAILDVGLQKSTRGNRVYAFLKGVLDTGVIVPCSIEILPPEERITGKHIGEKVVKNFEDVKKKILSE